MERRKKEYPNVERACFFSPSSHFVLARPHSVQQSRLPHIKTTISHFLSCSLCFIPSCKYSPHSFPSRPSVLSLWSVLQCLTQPLYWPQIQIQILLHWHDKRWSLPGFFSVPGLQQSHLPRPSNLCFSLECGLYDLEEG